MGLMGGTLGAIVGGECLSPARLLVCAQNTAIHTYRNVFKNFIRMLLCWASNDLGFPG